MGNSDDSAPATPAANDEMPDEPPRITSLRPTSGNYSQRRLLNMLSIGVAVVVILVLGIQWLPGLLATLTKLTASQSLPYVPHIVGQTPTADPGWKPIIGPDWAESIVFASDASAGYACGTPGTSGNAPILVARFAANAVQQNAWKASTIQVAGSSCRIFVSPYNAEDVILFINRCPATNCNRVTTTAVYRSRDGGTTWTPVALPAPLDVTGVAWTHSALFLAVWGHLPDDDIFAPVNSEKESAHLLVSQDGGAMIEVASQHLTGRSQIFDVLAVYSTGTTLYVALDTPCARDCPAITRTDDNGAHWTPVSASYAGSPVTLSAVQTGDGALVGFVVRPSDQTTVMLRSMDKGATWQPLPAFPVNPATGGVAIFILPDGSVYAFCSGDASVVYALGARATQWQTLAPLPSGKPLTVQYNASGHAVALWGAALPPASSSSRIVLEYFPIAASSLG